MKTEQAAPLKVLILAGRAMEHQRIGDLLAAADQPVSMAMADDLAAVLDCLARRVVDVLLLGFPLPSGVRIEDIEGLAFQFPPLAIIVVGAVDEAPESLDAVRRGAIGFVDQETFASPHVTQLLRRAADRQRSIAALHARDSLARAVFDQTSEGIYVIDATTLAIQECNRAFSELVGESPERMVGRAITEFIDVPASEVAARVARVMAGQAPATIHRAYRRSDGATFVAEATASLLDHGGRHALCTLVRNITAEQEAEAISRRLVAALEATTDTILITGPDGTIRYVNRAFSETTGYSAAEAIGQNPRLLNSDQQEPGVYAELWRTITAGRVWRGQLVNRRRDHTLYSVRATIIPTLDEEGRISEFVALQQDITPELEAQARLARGETLEAVGQLTAGVAHDFNNLLQAVMGYNELLQDRLPPGDEGLEYAAEIESVVRRGAKLVQQLLLFSSHQVDEPRALALNDVVQDVQKLLARTLGEDVVLTLDLAPELPQIHASEVQLQQVLMNMAVNARHAMPAGGELAIATQCANGASPGVGQAGRSMVCLSIRDSGCGMSPEVLAKAFDAFYSTKGHQGGTGLGLATVQSVVQRADGRIEVESEEGVGTLFKLYFPARAVGPAAPGIVEEELSAAPQHGQELILMVDDEGPIRDIVRRLLVRNGYRVVLAAHGAEALEVAAELSTPADLLITDVVMPRMSGPELANELTQRWPALRVLYISGYVSDQLYQHGLTRDSTCFLAKPFSPSTLMAKMREVLAA